MTKDKADTPAAKRSTFEKMWSKTIGDEVYVYYCGQLVYKRWKHTGKSILVNQQWPNSSTNRQT